MSTLDLPLVDAVLNGSAATLLLLGRRAIARGDRDRHRALMLSALAVSAMFLAGYLTFHALHGSTRFTGQGPMRVVYFSILFSHTILAIVNLPLIIVTVRYALLGQFPRHRRLAKVSWAVWMYVSVTGVVVYLLLYRF